jgi:hypothetical protein
MAAAVARKTYVDMDQATAAKAVSPDVMLLQCVGSTPKIVARSVA